MKSAHSGPVVAARALFAAGAIWWVVLSVLLRLGVVSVGRLDETTLAMVAALMLAFLTGLMATLVLGLRRVREAGS